MKLLLLALLLPGCAGFKGPLFDPHAKWNPQMAQVWDPCPAAFPYLDPGAALHGQIVCTVRPMDIQNEDVDTQPEP